MSKRKIALMHELYGVNVYHICGQCCNYFQGLYRSRTLRKCARYGATHSEATDWAKSYTACGMFNTPLRSGERSVMEIKKTMPRKKPTDAVHEGQMTIYD